MAASRASPSVMAGIIGARWRKRAVAGVENNEQEETERTENECLALCSLCFLLFQFISSTVGCVERVFERRLARHTLRSNLFASNCIRFLFHAHRRALPIGQRSPDPF